MEDRAGRWSEFEEMKIGGGKDWVVGRVYKSVYTSPPEVFPTMTMQKIVCSGVSSKLISAIYQLTV